MDNKPESHLLVIFGASGDLTSRKLVPALNDLYGQGFLCDNFAILGVGRSPLSDDSFRSHLIEGLNSFSQVNTRGFDEFLQGIYYQAINTKEAEDYVVLNQRIQSIMAEKNIGDNIIFYLATPPGMFDPIAQNLKSQGLHKETENTGFRRIIIEKPFGHDLASAKDLNDKLRRVFKEEQIYRIDHYLGKETVQNLLVTRFSNAIFEPLWNRNFISHIEITASESIGIGGRSGYYDSSGAMRDMFQNHLIQLLTLVAMEPPTVIDSESIRTESMKVLQSLRPVSMDRFKEDIVRGQYTASKIKGEDVRGYREEEGVAEDSRTESFLAARIWIDNWRWAGVPFFLRTGKRLPTRVTEIVINFRHTPHHLFRQNESIARGNNQLIIRIQPDEGVLLNFGMKMPGAGYEVKNVGMDFHYSDLSSIYLPSAYERLLLDCMLGDSTLFSRGDNVELAWEFVQPIIDRWSNDADVPLYGYPAGTWGPKEADDLVSIDGRTWRFPCKNLSNSDEYCEL